MKRIHTRKLVVTFFSLVLLLSLAPSFAGAETLGGHVRFVYGSIGGSTGYIYIYRSTGAFCGVATLAGIGGANSSTVAYEGFRDVLLGVPPFTAGHYVVAFTNTPAGFCTRTTGAMTAYYFRY